MYFMRNICRNLIIKVINIVKTGGVFLGSPLPLDVAAILPDVLINFNNIHYS